MDNWRSLTILVLPLGLSCALPTPFYISPKADKSLSWQTRGNHSTHLTLFSDKSYRLTAKSPQKWKKLQSSGDIFLIKVLANSAAHDTIKSRLHLQTQSQILIYQPPNERQPGYAFLQTQDHISQSQWAAVAHRQSSFGCGMIQRLTGFGLVETPKVNSSVYSENIRLPEVSELLEKVDATAIKADIQKLQDLGTRFHRHESGLAASETVKSMFSSALSDRSDVEVYDVDHGTLTPQKSVIAKFSGKSKADELVIIGAHLDSINAQNQDNAPGADDDASGTATLAAVMRILKEANFQRSVEFHAYAAEEQGLIGSGDLAKRYQQQNTNVVAMLQLDMTSYSEPVTNNKIYLVSTDTTPSLRRSLKSLMATYLDGNFAEASLNSGTSDHRSWLTRGYPVVFPFENPLAFNRNLHTENDNLEILNNDELTKRFAKLTLAFIAHYAGLSSAEASYQSAIVVESNLAKDLHVAIQPAEVEGFHHFAIAAPKSIKSVEICRLADKSDRRCLGDITLLEVIAGPNEDRNFFISPESSPFVFASSETYLLQGFNEKDEIHAQRAIKLVEKK